MTRVLFVIGEMGIGGKERQLGELLKHLPKNKFSLGVFAKSAHPIYQKTIEENCDFFLFTRSGNFSLRDIFLLHSAFTEFDPDIVYTWSSFASHLCLIVLGLTISDSVLINGSIRSAPTRLNFLQRIEKRLYSAYPYVVANSWAGLRVYGQAKKKGRFVLYNGFDQQRLQLPEKVAIRRSLKLPPEIFIVTMVANLTKEKDYETFLKAAKICTEISNEFLFISVGEGPERKKIESHVLNNSLTGKFILLGSRNDIESILRASDISVLCSSNGEGISNAILESMACGVPVIATATGGNHELISNNKNGYLIHENDFAKLASKLIYLKDDRAKLANMSIACRKTVHKGFSITRMTNAFDDIIAIALRGEPE